MLYDKILMIYLLEDVLTYLRFSNKILTCDSKIKNYALVAQQDRAAVS